MIGKSAREPARDAPTVAPVNGQARFSSTGRERIEVAPRIERVIHAVVLHRGRWRFLLSCDVFATSSLYGRRNIDYVGHGFYSQRAGGSEGGCARQAQQF